MNDGPGAFAMLLARQSGMKPDTATVPGFVNWSGSAITRTRVGIAAAHLGLLAAHHDFIHQPPQYWLAETGAPIQEPGAQGFRKGIIRLGMPHREAMAAAAETGHLDQDRFPVRLTLVRPLAEGAIEGKNTLLHGLREPFKFLLDALKRVLQGPKLIVLGAAGRSAGL